uniref:Uncharacterized protein n=1 Tax=Romanomermis culicivorax TaxID=13658 RepID=A0A915J057_ROMCU
MGKWTLGSMGKISSKSIAFVLKLKKSKINFVTEQIGKRLKLLVKQKILVSQYPRNLAKTLQFVCQMFYLSTTKNRIKKA